MNTLQWPFGVVLNEGANVLLIKMTGAHLHHAIAHFTDADGLTCALDLDARGMPLIRQEPVWVPVADEPAQPMISVIASIERKLYAGTEGHGILRCNEDTRAWDELNDGLPVDEFVFVYDFLTLDDSLYAATSHGVYRLPPDTDRWEPRNGDLTDFYATAIAASDDWTYAGTWEGRIFRSPNRGETWEQVYGPPAKVEAAASN